MIKEKIRVAHIIYGLKYGGAEKLLIPFTTKIDKSKYEVIVIVLYSGGPVEKELKEKGVEVTVIRRDARFGILDLFKLIRILKEKRVCVIHTHLFLADFWGGIAGALLRIKHVSTVHSGLFMDSPFLRFKQRLRLLFPNRIIAVSRTTKKIYVEQCRIKEDRFTVIYNGVDVGKFKREIDSKEKKRQLGIPEDSRVLGTTGRLEMHKGHCYLIEAMPQIRRRHRNIILLVAGEGSLKQSLVDRVRELEIDKNVVFLGERDDVPELLQVFDLTIFPSLHEGFSIAALEAMAAGRPVIATRVGGMPELIDDGKTGLLVKSEDPAAITGAIERLLDDPSLAKTLASAGERLVRNMFTEKNMISQICQVYQEVLQKGG